MADDHRHDGRELAERDADFPGRHRQADDEISLYDLWDVLVRRRSVIAVVFLVIVGVGLAYALNQDAQYQYRTGYEIGTLTSSSGEERLIESAAETRNRLREGVIPVVRAAMAEEMENVPRVDLSGAGESGLVILSTRATPDRADAVGDLHRRVVERVEGQHAQVVEQRRQDLLLRKQGLADELDYLRDERVLTVRRQEREQRIEAAEGEIEALEAEREETRAELEASIRDRERAIEGLEAQAGITRAEIGRLDDREAVIRERVESTQETLDTLASARADLLRSTSSDGALALMLSTGEVGRIENRLAELENRLRFGLARERDELEEQLADNQREQSRVADALGELRLERENLEARFERQIAQQRRTIRSQEADLERLQANHDRDVRNQQREIEQLELQVSNLEPSEATFTSLRSLSRAGSGPMLILALSIVLGGMLGLFSAFFWEFVSNARNRQ